MSEFGVSHSLKSLGKGKSWDCDYPRRRQRHYMSYIIKSLEVGFFANPWFKNCLSDKATTVKAINRVSDRYVVLDMP